MAGFRAGFFIDDYMNDVSQPPQDLALAQAAARGEATARAQVNNLAHPLIDYHTRQFCKRYCHENHRIYRCTLSPPLGTAAADALLCEWGNASYGWMLDDLTRPQRLQKYQAKNGASLFDYLYRIANSLPFYERWKDWRFGRRVHVPEFVADIAPQAGRIFLELRSGHELPFIAQQLGMSQQQAERISIKIIQQLTQRHKLYLLDAPSTQSLDSTRSGHEEDDAEPFEVAVEDASVELDDERARMQNAWRKLDPVEQFVLQSLVVDELDARSVLQALSAMEVSIRKGVDASDTSVQQLYYFKRKALAKLGKKLC